ncbi:hypothetical protein SAMN05421538_11428 [Paracoccus isoporae]|uniref:Yip1 domain-containing protein n=1 Tax=Paracoccus isoporae TaxID=591205 RepID=A0A1G7GP87_9RHOB|nr:hypothetical protein [Paracoccus isoporae]SDE89965.1 hypothetical protein SAMN05421538_11428 [Paracoccus isoporae]
MADTARLNAGLVPRILASWWRPGEVVRGLHPLREGAMLAVLMAAMLVFLIAQAPGHARAAELDHGVPLGGRMAGAAMAVLFVMPLLAYATAWVVQILSRLTPWAISGPAARLALFWALLAIAPAMLLSGLVEGLMGPGAALSVTRLICGIGFLLIWGAGLRAVARTP